MPITGRGFDDSCFEIKDSTITNAGKGLFTKIRIPTHTKVTEYTGELKKEKKCKNFKYAFDIGAGYVIDASKSKKSGIARYINDAYGTKKRNNLRWFISRNSGRVWLVSKRTIAAGAELLVDYGQDYWEMSKQNILDSAKLSLRTSTATGDTLDKEVGNIALRNALVKLKRKREDTFEHENWQHKKRKMESVLMSPDSKEIGDVQGDTCSPEIKKSD